MNKFLFNTWKLIWHAYVDLQMWLLNEQIVIQCFEPYLITCLCWCAHVDAKWTNLWFDTWKLIRWKLIRWHAYVDLRMCLSNVQIMIQHLEAYLTACQFAHVDVKWTNCDSTLASLFNMLMSICKCWMNKLFNWHGFCFPSSFKMNKFSFHVLSTCAHEMWNEHRFCICENGVKIFDKPGDLTSRFVWWACDWEASDRKLIFLIRGCWAWRCWSRALKNLCKSWRRRALRCSRELKITYARVGRSSCCSCCNIMSRSHRGGSC